MKVCVSGNLVTDSIVFRKAIRDAQIAASVLEARNVQQPAADDIWMDDPLSDDDNDDNHNNDDPDNPFTAEIASLMSRGYDGADEFLDQDTTEASGLSAKGWTAEKMNLVEQVDICLFHLRNY